MSDMDTNQNGNVALDPTVLSDVMHQRILELTSENIQLGAYVKQLKQEIVELSARQEKGEADGAQEAN